MTCIVGLIEDGIIYMGGDSATCDGGSVQIINGSKVFKRDDFLFGISGSPRMADVLKYNFEIPFKEYKDQNDLEFLHKFFIPELRTALSVNGVLNNENEFLSSDSWVLIGYNCRLFLMDNRFHLGENRLKYNAVGSGACEALGCLYGLHDLMKAEWIKNLSPHEKIKLALRASEAFNCCVRGPFTIISTDENK